MCDCEHVTGTVSYCVAVTIQVVATASNSELQIHESSTCCRNKISSNSHSWHCDIRPEED